MATVREIRLKPGNCGKRQTEVREFPKKQIVIYSVKSLGNI